MNTIRTKTWGFVTGAYITRDEAQAAFDRQRARDAIGDRVMLWLAAVGVAGIAGPTVVAEVALAPLLVFFFVRTRNTLRTWIHWFGQPVFLLVLAFAAWQATTLLWTRDLHLGLVELGRLRWAVIGVLVWPIIHKRRTILAALAVGFACAHVAQLVQLVGILQHDGTFDPVFHRDPRRISGWWDPVVGGSMLVGAVGLHLPIAVFWRGPAAWIARAGLLAAVLGVIATGTRGAWLAAFALVGAALVLAVWRAKRGRRAPASGDGDAVARSPRRVGVRIGVISLVVVAAGAGLWLAAGPALVSRIEQARTELQQASDGDTNTDIGRRLDMAEWAGRAILTHPVGGVGAGGFRAWVETEGGPFVFDHAHNAALHLGATTGLVGLAIWGLLLIVLARNGVVNLRTLGDPRGTSGPLFAMLGLILVSAFDVVPINSQTAALWWLLAGVCLTWEPGDEDQFTTEAQRTQRKDKGT